jgi:hypothetical protein
VNTNVDCFSDAQLEFFSEPVLLPIKSGADARTRYGTAAEEVACALLHLRRLKISGNFTACYDAQDRARRLYEIKSVRRGGSCPVWTWRIRKDKDVGRPVVYLFVLHDVKHAPDTHDMWRQMSSTVRKILIAPLGVVEEAHAAGRLGGVNTDKGPRNGFNREGYREGYRYVSMKFVESRLIHTGKLSASVRGHPFEVDVFC